MPEASMRVDVLRVSGEGRGTAADCAAVEEPLEIRLGRRPFAVVMRTPGADHELAAGFLFSEGIVRNADELGTIEYCADADPDGGRNVVNVTLTGGEHALERAFERRRQVTTNSSCGMCGRLTIESLTIEAAAIQSKVRVSPAIISALPDRLRSTQPVFSATGGLHAAGLFAPDGRLDSSAEDVGRHNAVDKVIGRKLMRDALPLSDSILVVSGRTSFEIVQKAFLAGIPVLASVSAPSSLAIDLAKEAGITLVGFVRGATFNVYANPLRIT